MVDLYIKVSFSELIEAQWGSDIDDADFVLGDESDDEYHLGSGSDSGEFLEKDSDYD